jgi:hypothetical protein
MRRRWAPRKLTAQQALDIHLLARSGLFYQQELAAAYGISRSNVSLLMHRKRWQWLFEREKEQLMSKVEIEQVELDELYARMAKLEKANAPPAPFKSNYVRPPNPLDRASMSKETMAEFAKAIPEELAADLRADLARGNPLQQSPAQLTPDRGGGRGEIRGTGWAAERKIESPPGISLADRLMDMQDQIDRADLQRRLALSKE